MKKRKILKRVLIFLAIIAGLCTIFWIAYQRPSVADVGSFESYDSGSSYSGGSSYGGGSSYSGGSSYGSGSSYRSTDDDDDWGIFYLIYLLIRLLFDPTIPFLVRIIMLGIIIAVIAATVKTRNREKAAAGNMPEYIGARTNSADGYTGISEADIVKKIQTNDPKFDVDQFKSFAKDVFIKLQNAWTERDWEKIRPLESNELFEQHKAQLQGYINNNQINVMERICVNWVKVYSFDKAGDNEILTVDLNSRMGDYIIDATTKELIKGNKTTEYVNTYRLKFIRTIGAKTPEEGQTLGKTNCPNCGAPTTVMTSGKCEYCGSVITSRDYGWVLSSLERHKDL